MEERRIIDLFWKRSEDAIAETQRKYQRYCHSIAFAILGSDEDAEECVNDTYSRAWNSIPPNRPDRLEVFLGKITRHLAFDRYRKSTAKRRRHSEISTALDELEECIPSLAYPSDMSDGIVLRDTLNAFLRSLPEENMNIFTRRYWYTYSIADIAKEYGISESNVKIKLHRMRLELKEYLEKEGIVI